MQQNRIAQAMKTAKTMRDAASRMKAALPGRGKKPFSFWQVILVIGVLFFFAPILLPLFILFVFFSPKRKRADAGADAVMPEVKPAAANTDAIVAYELARAKARPPKTAPSAAVRPTPRMAAQDQGRARIEAMQPNPDGTYELDLHVSPRSRASYGLTVALVVPPEHTGRIRRGGYLQALLRPDDPAWIDIDWSK